MKKKSKSIFNKPIICKRCGKRVGWVTVKWRFRTKLIVIGFLVALVTQFIAEGLIQILFGF